jgi:hypothetical protein
VSPPARYEIDVLVRVWNRVHAANHAARLPITQAAETLEQRA